MNDSKLVKFESDFVKRLVILLFECQKRIAKCYFSSKDGEALDLSFVLNNLYCALDILDPQSTRINSDMLNLLSQVSERNIFPSKYVYKKTKA